MIMEVSIIIMHTVLCNIVPSFVIPARNSYSTQPPFPQNIFHGSMSVDQLYLSRPSHLCPSYSAPVPGLYLCGSGAHPGIYAYTPICMDNAIEDGGFHMQGVL